MTSAGMSSRNWVKFFQDAGISAELSARYAVMFTDHRIQKDMIGDLDRDILSDIGVKAVGDKMAIMKHAKFVMEQAKRDASSKELADDIKTLENESTKSLSPVKHVANLKAVAPPPVQEPPKVSKTESADGPTKISENKRNADAELLKKTVFDRLGQNSPVDLAPKPSGVFGRLGGANSGTDSPHGKVIKSPVPVPGAIKKKILVTKEAKTASVLNRLGDEVPDSSSQVKKAAVNQPKRKTVVKKVVTLKKRAVTAPTKFPSASPKTVAVSRSVNPSTQSAVKRKSNVLDRLGKVAVKSPSVSEVDAPVSKTLTPGVTARKLIVLAPKKVTVPLKRKSTGDLPASSAKKPISSNTVSSTSAGLFRGRARSSVFDRLGKMK